MIFDLLFGDYKHIFSILEEWRNENFEFFHCPLNLFQLTFVRIVLMVFL